MTEKEEEKDPGFPIKNVGNDREGKTEMTEGGEVTLTLPGFSTSPCPSLQSVVSREIL